MIANLEHAPLNQSTSAKETNSRKLSFEKNPIFSFFLWIYLS